MILMKDHNREKHRAHLMSIACIEADGAERGWQSGQINDRSGLEPDACVYPINENTPTRQMGREIHED